MLKYTDDPLDHDDGAVHEDAEVERADAEQAHRHARQVHTQEREQQRERDRERRQEGRAQAHEEHQKHGHDDDEAFGQDPDDGVQRILHEFRLVMDRHDLDPARQAGGIDLFDRLMDVVQDLAWILTPTHEDDRLYAARAQRIAVDGEDAGLRQVAHRKLADVAHEDRHVLLRIQHDVADVLAVLDESRPADGERLLPHPQQGAARVSVVVLHRVGDLPNAEVVVVERARIHLDLVLAHESAEGCDIGHSRHLE